MSTVGRHFYPALLIGSVVAIALIWIAGDVLALFLIAIMLAYLLDPLAERMVRWGIPRYLAAFIITSSVVILFGGILALLGPIAYDQMESMLKTLRTVFTDIVTWARREMTPYVPALRQVGLGGLVKPTDQSVGDLAGPIAASVVTGGVAFVSTIALGLLIPVVTFYLLKDWPVLLRRALEVVTPEKRPQARELAHEIDRVMSAFLHGQAWVCLCVGIMYSAGLMLVGLNYGLVVGLVSGVLKFLPYVGTVVAVAIALGAGIGQAGWDGWLMTGIGLTYGITEIIESSILSPRIIGNRVQLHPALVIFAVLVGGKMLGVIGVFIAIPVVAVGRVLLVFFLRGEAHAAAPLGDRIDRNTQSDANPVSPPQNRAA